GQFVALELRDGDPESHLGSGVLEAVGAVEDEVHEAIVRLDGDDQRLVDEALIELDGTDNKSRLRQNAVLVTPLAVARAAAVSVDLPLYRYHGCPNAHVVPVPMMNILNGGSHADSNVDIQEFMIAPIGAASFHEALQWSVDVYHALKGVLKDRGLSTGLGDE